MTVHSVKEQEAGGLYFSPHSIANGLIHAKEKGWNTKYKAIIGGASFLAEDYIDDGQDTLYLQKFDVDNSDEELYWHQYMQNILAAQSEGTH